jgi:hypothetical protein
MSNVLLEIVIGMFHQRIELTSNSLTVESLSFVGSALTDFARELLEADNPFKEERKKGEKG